METSSIAHCYSRRKPPFRLRFKFPTFPRLASMMWHTLGIKPRPRNSYPTLIAIRPRTHYRIFTPIFEKSNLQGKKLLTYYFGDDRYQREERS